MKNKLFISALVIPMALGLFLSTAQAATIASDISTGASNSDVTTLQTFLITKGYLTIPAGQSSGHFGDLTRAAVIKYQAAEGIVADGIVGSTTRAHIAADGGMAVSIAPSTTTKAAGLRVAMHDILDEHITSSLSVLRAIHDGNIKARDGALVQQDANAQALAAAVGSVYGTDAQTGFLKLFRDHIVDSNAYTQGVKDNSMQNQAAALAELDKQLVGISSFLSGANPNIDNATLLAALREHEDLVNKASVAYSKGDYTGSYKYESDAIKQIGGGADYLSAAIVKQYPEKFTN